MRVSLGSATRTTRRARRSTATEWREFLAALPDRCVAVVDEAYGDYLAPERRRTREVDVAGGRRVVVLAASRSSTASPGFVSDMRSSTRHSSALRPPRGALQRELRSARCRVRLRFGPVTRRARRRRVAEGARGPRRRPAQRRLRAAPIETNFVLAGVDVDDVELGDSSPARDARPSGLRTRPARLRPHHSRPADLMELRERARDVCRPSAHPGRVARVLVRLVVPGRATCRDSRRSRRRRRDGGRHPGRERTSSASSRWSRVTAAMISSLPALRVVATPSVGFDQVDVAATATRGVWVCNVPDYCVEEMADHTMALLLALVRGVVELDRSVRDGAWDHQAAGELRRISDVRFGVVGFGRIGRRRRRARARARHGGVGLRSARGGRRDRSGGRSSGVARRAPALLGRGLRARAADAGDAGAHWSVPGARACCPSARRRQRRRGRGSSTRTRSSPRSQRPPRRRRARRPRRRASRQRTRPPRSRGGSSSIRTRVGTARRGAKPRRRAGCRLGPEPSSKGACPRTRSTR